MADDPFTHEPRTRLTAQQLARLYVERGKRCHRCKRPLGPSDTWSDEHLIALENGGGNEWTNRDITCSWCKPLKDGEDHALAAKARHVYARHVVPSALRVSARGFKGWRKFDGTVVWRGRK